MTTKMTLQQAKDLAIGAHKSQQEILLMKEIERFESEVQRLQDVVIKKDEEIFKLMDK